MLRTRTSKNLGFLTLFILIITQFSYSQENYIPGYVIKKNNDEVKGFIDYKNWNKNPKEVKFKTSIDGKSTLFRPVDIIEFGIRDEIYVSGIVETEITELKTDKLDDIARLRIKTDTTFLQTLFRGDKDLYYYKNSNSRDNFYVKREGNFELLVYKKYFRLQDGRKVIVENNKYLGQLDLYLKNCPEIKSKLFNTSYGSKSISKLFERYYECVPSNVSFQKKQEKLKSEIGTLMGISSTSLNFQTSEFLQYLESTDYNQSNNFTAGLFLDLVFPRNQGKWSLNSELLYTSYSFQGTYEFFRDERNNSKTVTELGFSYLKLNNMFRYKYPIGKAHIYLNVGISNGLVLSEKSFRRTEQTRFGTDRTDEGLAIESRKLEQGIIAGLGFKFNKCSIEIRGERGNGMSNSQGASSSTESYFILLGYKF